MITIMSMVFSKRKEIKNRKATKLNALALPILAVFIPENILIIMIALAAIIVVLLLYLVYLFLKANKLAKQQPNQMVLEQLIVNEVTVKEEEKKVVPPVVVTPAPKVAPVVVAEKTRKIYNYSFQSRLHLSDAETSDRYNEVKNHLLSYEGVSSHMSWKQETFTVRGKMAVKLRLQGKTMRVYIGVDPAKYVDSIYNIEDVSQVKTHQTTPSLLIVKGPGNLRHVLELIDDFMQELEVSSNPEYKVKSFKEKKIGREKLIEMNLIKVQDAKFIEKATK